MAYAALNSLMLTLEQILLKPDTRLIPYEKQHVESLHNKLGYLQVFLEDLSHKGNETTACLQRRIRDSAYEAEDITDLYLTNKIPENGDLQNIIDEFDSIIEEATKIKDKLGTDITKEFDSPMEEATKIDKLRQDDLHPWNSLRASSSKSVLMVGFDDHLMQIKDQLTGDSCKLKVIPLVGMGGIGKTTLATNIYTDSSIVNHFDIRAWATVSQSYCIRDIMLSFLDSMKNLTDEMHQESDDQLGLHLYKALKGRRYLIIIDDIWDTDAWDGVRRMFPDDNTGSRIILTTRQSGVAAYATSSGTLHPMTPLSDDKSWDLLCAKVFGEKPCPLNFLEIGKKIAQNCRGLPLSIVVIGGLLSRLNITQDAWRDVAENVTSTVNSSADQCLKILELSYNYLPQRLKACFLYLGAFPEDYEISVSKLTKLWVAEGFLKQGQFQTLEEGAERCLEELAERSLILVSKQNFDGKIKKFRIHDLLRQLSVNEANDEKFLQVIKRYVNIFPGSSHSQRRTSIHPMSLSKNHCFPYNSIPSILFTRSLVCLGIYCFLSNVFLRFKLLKVLDAIRVDFCPFPSEIFELLNLRYVAFMYKGEIPASISKLRNLQTLIIHQQFSAPIYLPVEIWEMTHLRHVEFKKAYLLDPIGEQFDIDGKHLVLKDLQTLSGIGNLRFTENMLKRIPNIKKLEFFVDDVLRWKEKGWSYYHLENLVNLHQLEALKITVILDLFTSNTLLAPLPKPFDFPSTLKKLTLSGCEIPWDDLAIVSSLPNLEVLKLKDQACVGMKWEANELEFCKLRLLVFEGLDLKHWIADYCNFPSLEHLILRHCYSLVEIPYGMGESSTLLMIELDNSNASLLTSAQKIKETQQSLGNDGFQVVVQELRLKVHLAIRAGITVFKEMEATELLSYQTNNQMQGLELLYLFIRDCKSLVSRSNPEISFYEIFKVISKILSRREVELRQLINFLQKREGD